MEEVFAELYNAYTNSAEGQKSCMIGLVCIRNVRKIIDSGISLRKLLGYSEVPIHYRKEASLGLNLSKYVKEK